MHLTKVTCHKAYTPLTDYAHKEGVDFNRFLLRKARFRQYQFSEADRPMHLYNTRNSTVCQQKTPDTEGSEMVSGVKSKIITNV